MASPGLIDDTIVVVKLAGLMFKEHTVVMLLDYLEYNLLGPESGKESQLYSIPETEEKKWS